MKMLGFLLVADAVRHLKTFAFNGVYATVRILTNSATFEFSLNDVGRSPGKHLKPQMPSCLDSDDTMLLCN